MRSSNPVFSRRGLSRDSDHAGFGAGQQQQAGNPYAAGPAATNPYAKNPYAQQPAAPGQPYPQGAPPVAPPQTGRMTMDDVVARTGITLGTVIVTAAAAWILNVGLGIAIVAALVAMGLAFVQIFKRKPSPPVILAYAAFEGVFLGAISNFIDNKFAGGSAAGVPMQAVLGTMAVFAAVLFMYKQRIIRVNKRFYQFVMAAAIGFILLMGVNLLFAVFAGGDGLGFRSGGLGILFGVIGIVLGAAFLALDFKQVEDGIAYGAPREESWLAAFGLTLTLVWIYLEFLRLLSILNSD